MPDAVEIVWTFMVDYTKGWGIAPHTHDYYQMYYVIAGSAAVLVDGRGYDLAPDACLIIRPGQRHELPPLQAGQFRFIDTKFRVLAPELSQELEALPQSTVMSGQDFRALQRDVRDEWVSNLPHSRQMARLMFEQSLYLYLRHHDQGILRLPFYQTVEDRMGHLQGPAREVADYLSAHYLEPLDLDQVAERLRYNKNYLCTVFKEATDFTIVGYLNFLRISKAYDLVRYSDRKISDISAACGFSSIHYFSRVFHKITGQTPSEVHDKDKNALNTDIRLHGQFQYRYYQGTED